MSRLTWLQYTKLAAMSCVLGNFACGDTHRKTMYGCMTPWVCESREINIEPPIGEAADAPKEGPRADPIIMSPKEVQDLKEDARAAREKATEVERQLHLQQQQAAPPNPQPVTPQAQPEPQLPPRNR